MLQLLCKSPGDKVTDDRLAVEGEIHFTCAVSLKLLNYFKPGEDGFHLKLKDSCLCLEVNGDFKVFN